MQNLCAHPFHGKASQDHCRHKLLGRSFSEHIISVAQPNNRVRKAKWSSEMGKIPSPSLKDELLLICLFEQIISASISVIPEQIIRSCRLAERSFIIALYLLFSAIYSTSTIAWFATRLQKISLYRWYIYTLAIIIFWALLGVTHAELFLFFLPLSISIGICLYSICSRLFVIPPSDKRCGEDQD